MDFIDCSGEDTPPFEVEDVDVLDKFDEEIRIPGTDVVTQSIALTVRLEVRQGLRTDSLEHTFHVYDIDSEWA